MAGFKIKMKIRPDILDEVSGSEYSCYAGKASDADDNAIYPGDTVVMIQNSGVYRKGDEGIVLGFSDDSADVIVEFGVREDNEDVIGSFEPGLLRKVPRLRRSRR